MCIFVSAPAIDKFPFFQRSVWRALSNSVNELIQIPEVSSDRLDFCPVIFGIPIIKEFLIAAVQSTDASGVLDRAPILLRACGNFLDVGDQSVKVTAIAAVEFFNKIQIIQILRIEYDIVFALDFRDAVNRKAGGLINRDDQVHEQCG